MAQTKAKLSLKFFPTTPDRWGDVEKLFGERGACGGCWCMLWRLPRPQYERQKGQGNREALKSIVEAGSAPGVLAYADGQAVGWCALAPREDYPRLERSRLLQRVDDKPVWSVTCFFVAKHVRRTGVSVELLKAAVAHAKSCGARIVEGYPIAPRKDPMPDVFANTGLVATFRRAGFKEITRRSATRPIMRFVVDAPHA